jgi:hypothetical protein
MSDRLDTDKTNLSRGPDLDTVREEEAHRGAPRLADDRAGRETHSGEDTPSGDDPFVPGAEEVPGGFTDDIDRDSVSTPIGDGPTYERDQGPADDHTGGSTDPHNTLGHADSGKPRE